MSLDANTEADLKHRSAELLKRSKDPVERLRLACLSRGANGIRGLGRCFRIMDDNRNRKLDFREFQNGLNDYGLMLQKEEMLQMFNTFDRDKSGSVDFDEFLEHLRPPMSERRKRIINMAFVKLDRTGDGKITVDDLRDCYNVKHHAKYKNGEWSQDQCLREFLNAFDVRGGKDGVITKDDFLNYYSAVSASIDQDPYFDLMMRNAYALEGM